jgi:Zn-dependent protease
MFRLFGFPVHVRGGFVMFMLLIVALNGSEFGLWFAGSIAVFTLIHELGHAVAARRTGAKAEISLDFMVGYASYVPTRPLTRAEQAGISFAGPAVEIAIGTAVLVAMGYNPFDIESIDDSAAALSIWWAGPVLGLVNLLPILPLDGGNIAMTGLDKILPGRSLRPMVWTSIVLTVGLAIFLYVRGWPVFSIFVAFLLISQLQMLGRDRAPVMSPWESASQALDAGRTGKARRTLIAALSHPQPTPPTARLALSPERAEELIELLPQPYPHGDAANEFVLANLLLVTGRFDDAAHYAADTYGRRPNTMSAVIVARAAAALGDSATAIAWLRTAADAGTSPAGLASAIDHDAEFAGIRQHPDVIEIRRSLAPAN